MGLLTCLALGLTAAQKEPPALHAPGLGVLELGDRAPGDLVARFDGKTGTPQGKGFVTMHRGHLLVPFSADGGGGGKSGGFAFFDVSDPGAPRKVFSTRDDPDRYHTPGAPDFAGNLREPHGFSIVGDVWCMTCNRGPATGLQFWDLSDVRAPRKLSELQLPVMTGGDYDSTPWWVFWQGGRYAYVAGTGTGLHIVDASDPSAPFVVRRVPVPDLAGFRVNTVFAVGNLLAITNADLGGLATFDIQDPAQPRLLARSDAQTGYSAMVNGGRLIGLHDPVRLFDLETLAEVARAPDLADKGGYGLVQDGALHCGSSTAYLKLDLTSDELPPLLRRERAGKSDDWDFAVPLGNLVFVGNDHGASYLAVHDATPDTMPPRVTMVHPADGAEGLATSTRVGLTFSDQLLTETLTGATVQLRRAGDAAVPCTISNQTAIVNLWPEEPLKPDTDYVVEVVPGGVADLSGNRLVERFTARFRTGSAAPGAVRLAGGRVAREGAPVRLVATVGDVARGDAVWTLPGGREVTAASVDVLPPSPGRWAVDVSIPGVGVASTTVVREVPRVGAGPRRSSTLAWSKDGRRLYVACPDQDALVEVDSGEAVRRRRSFAVGAHPTSVARGASGRLWVTGRDDDSISVVDPRAKRDGVTRHGLDHGARPRGIVAAGDGFLVALQGKGAVARVGKDGGESGMRLPCADPEHVALLADGSVLATRMRSTDRAGTVHRFDAALRPAPALRLAMDPGPDTEDSGRGLPNLLGRPGISPDGAVAWIPAKKDNVERGLARDGRDLGFESTVRTIAARLDLAGGAEDLGVRHDFNDRDMALAAAFDSTGTVVFVAFQGSDVVQALDARTGRELGGVEVGAAPIDLALHPRGDRLFVHCFLDRSLHVIDVSGFVDGTDTTMTTTGIVRLVKDERLAEDVLRGKRLFYRAKDTRMSLDGYLSCATCHVDGGEDGRVWDFTGRGEGLRNTITLRGRRGEGHGPLHWTANFDEVHDFEHDMRAAFGGTGFLTEPEFAAGTRSDALGDPKAGIDPDLDALAAYVRSLAAVPRSPHRASDGSLTDEALRGREHFARLDCARCHAGPDFTDSPSGLRHDVGTFGERSGSRRGEALDGLDTPTLLGIWNTAPYLHDGSAATVLEVLERSGPAHGDTMSLPPEERAELEAYLLSLDGTGAETGR